MKVGPVLAGVVAFLLFLGLQTPTAVGAPGSRIIATSGAMQLEGAAGGGIVPWALIAGYGSDTEWGGAAFHTRVGVDDFDVQSTGAAVGFMNRVEIGVAQQNIDVRPLDLSLGQDIVSAKVRVSGDLIYGQWPQLSAGLQYKRQQDFAVPALLGANDNSGIDYYLAASKLWLGGLAGYNLFTNVTLRNTEANQGGLLGFGGARGGRDWQVEASAAAFFNYHWAAGVEYRQKPDLLGIGEEDWRDAFIAWFPSKRFAVIAAYADLGNIAGLPDQSGWYLSLQVSQ